MSNQSIASRRIAEGREVMRLEADGITSTAAVIGVSFSEAVDMILGSTGKVVLSGVGKSGLIARKISATLNSTGTPSVWVSPVDALHGDIGLFQTDDVAVLLSKSGTSAELTELVRALSSRSVRIILITGGIEGSLARSVDLILPIELEREACPLDLAPTTSTTCMLALGDALAVVLMKERGFAREDFAVNHPSGALGRRLTMLLSDVMRTGDQIPVVRTDASFQNVILEISRKRLGTTLVSDEEGIVGIITDGDLRRSFERNPHPAELTAAEIMTGQPMTLPASAAAVEGLQILEKTRRAHLPVTDASGKVCGIVHLHDLVEAGL